MQGFALYNPLYIVIETGCGVLCRCCFLKGCIGVQVGATYWGRRKRSCRAQQQPPPPNSSAAPSWACLFLTLPHEPSCVPRPRLWLPVENNTGHFKTKERWAWGNGGMSDRERENDRDVHVEGGRVRATLTRVFGPLKRRRLMRFLSGTNYWPRGTVSVSS